MSLLTRFLINYLMPNCASSTILNLTALGRGLPFTNTPPSWFTSPYCCDPGPIPGFPIAAAFGSANKQKI